MSINELPAGYRDIGRGIVAEHKRRGSNEIAVIPIDQQPFQAGALVGDVDTLQASGTDAMGVAYTSSISASKAITATWLGDGDGRVTAPDVRRQDEVLLFTYHDTNRYFWKAINSDVGRRRQEVITHRCSATDDESVTELDDDNSISVHQDGENSIYTINVPKMKGKAGLKIQYNARDGLIVLADDRDNYIQIDASGEITTQNTNGTRVVVTGNNVETHASGTVSVEGTEKIHLITRDGTIDADAFKVNSKSTDIGASGRINIRAGGALGFSGTTVDFESSGSAGLRGTDVSIASDGLTHISGSNVDIDGVLNLMGSTTTVSAGIAQALADAIRPYL